MMGQWSDVRSASGKLLARIDGERHLLEIVRNGETALVDLDEYLATAASNGGIFFGEPSSLGEPPSLAPDVGDG